MRHILLQIIQIVSLVLLIVLLEEVSVSLFAWFDNNLMRSNVNKSYFSVSFDENITIQFAVMKLFKRKKVLVAHPDSKFSFHYHFHYHIRVLQKASLQVCASARVTLSKSLSKTRALMNAFVKSQFNYCPLIWMFHSHEKKNKINGIHEGCLRLIYNDT